MYVSGTKRKSMLCERAESENEKKCMKNSKTTLLKCHCTLLTAGNTSLRVCRYVCGDTPSKLCGTCVEAICTVCGVWLAYEQREQNITAQIGTECVLYT